MVEKIRKFDLRKAGIGSLIMGLINIIVHISVILKLIPYTWVNGGRTASFADAKQVAMSSIIITFITIIISLIASKIIPLKLNKFCNRILTVLLIVILPIAFMGIIQQFLGTTFEKCFMSIVTILSFAFAVRIAVEKR